MPDMMTVSDGIKVLKEKRNELQRLITLQREKFTVLVPIDKASVKECQDPNIIFFGDIEKQILDLKREIANLRFSLDSVGHVTRVSIDGNEVTLSYLRLMVEEARADIDRIQSLKQKESMFGERRRRLTADDKEREINQLTDRELEELTQEKIRIKNRFDSILEKTNVNTELRLSNFTLI